MTSVIDATGITFDLQSECVVIGAGACGLCTALRLVDGGVTPLVLERDAQPTGSTSMSSGFIPAAGTRQQRSQSIKDTAQQFATDIQHKACKEADADVVQAVTETIGPALDWLEQQHGFQWHVLDDFLYPGHSAHRMHAVPGKTGVALQNELLSACERQGVDIVTDARVDALVVDRIVGAGGSDPVKSTPASICGVRVVRPDGLFEYIQTNAVVLACNGYGANKQLMQRFVPQMAEAHYHGHCGNTGDAVLWGEQLQVPLVHTGAYQGHGSLAAGFNILITWALMMEGGVQINLHGQRFSNEHEGYSEQAENVIGQPDNTVWNVYDDRLHQLGLTFPDYQQALEAGAIKSAADIEQLASATGLPGEALSGTIANITALAENNSTDEFGRVFTRAHVLRAPYYAVKVAAAVFHTQGGLAVDSKARVINAQGKPVKHLLAAGGAACGVSGATVAGYLSGNGLLTAIGLGVIAADTVINETGGSSTS